MLAMASPSLAPSSGLITAGEAARRLGVAPITIQRWVDDGLLQARRTAGGHRRIPLGEIRSRLAAARPDRDQRRLAGWLDALLAGNDSRFVHLLQRARRRSGRWAPVADEVARAIAELGDRWQAGDCAVFEEHVATETLRRAAAACAAMAAPCRKARRALLTTVPGERHTLGLSLAELVLAERGWRAVWIGEGPPASEIGAMIAALAPDLCIVAARFDAEPGTLHTVQRRFERAVARAGARLILGGQARWSATKSSHRCDTFEQLDGVLTGMPLRGGRR